MGGGQGAPSFNQFFRTLIELLEEVSTPYGASVKYHMPLRNPILIGLLLVFLFFKKLSSL